MDMTHATNAKRKRLAFCELHFIPQGLDVKIDIDVIPLQ